MHPEPSLLIGSTAGRLALQEETDWAYEESAKIDKIKDANKQQEESAQINIFNRHPKLREETAACVFSVPSIVLHPTTWGLSYFSACHQPYFQGWFNNAKCIWLDW